MNFARDMVDCAGARPASRWSSWAGTGRAPSGRSAGSPASVPALAGTLRRLGVGRGDRVLTLIGNRPEWVLAMVACWRIGAVAVPCNEQLRAADLRLRLGLARPAVILADERNSAELGSAEPDCPVLLVRGSRAV